MWSHPAPKWILREYVSTNPTPTSLGYLTFKRWHGKILPQLRGLSSVEDRATHPQGSPHRSCKRDQIIMRDYMDRRVTSPTWGPSPSCKQALKFRSHVKIRIRPRVSLSLLETYFRNRIIRPQWYSHSLLRHSQPISRARLPASVWEISPCPFLGGWSFLPPFPFPPPPPPSLFLSWGQFNKTFTSVISKCNYCSRTLDRQTLVKVLLL